jgi:hypothetical protein
VVLECEPKNKIRKRRGKKNIVNEKKIIIPFASSADTRLDFIEDQQDVILVADLADSFEESSGCGDVSSLSQDWLDEDLVVINPSKMDEEIERER